MRISLQLFSIHVCIELCSAVFRTYTIHLTKFSGRLLLWRSFLGAIDNSTTRQLRLEIIVRPVPGYQPLDIEDALSYCRQYLRIDSFFFVYHELRLKLAVPTDLSECGPRILPDPFQDLISNSRRNTGFCTTQLAIRSGTAIAALCDDECVRIDQQVGMSVWLALVQG